MRWAAKIPKGLQVFLRLFFCLIITKDSILGIEISVGCLRAYLDREPRGGITIMPGIGVICY